MLSTYLLIFTVCFKHQCHEYVIESNQTLIECKHNGNQLEIDNPGTVWHCGLPNSVMPSYTPKESK